MKIKYIGILVTFLVLLSTCSKPLEDVYSTELKFPEFINIEVLNAASVVIEYGEEQRIIVTGNEFAIKEITSEVISETLIIDKESESPEGLNYRIITPFIREVKNSSDIDIDISDFGQDGYLSLYVTNTGDINLGQFDNLELLSVFIEDKGSVLGNKPFESLTDLIIKNIGSGDYFAFVIEAENVIVELEGSGSCSVYAKNELNAIVSGSGTVYYKGYPVVNTPIYANGSVVDVN